MTDQYSIGWQEIMDRKLIKLTPQQKATVRGSQFIVRRLRDESTVDSIQAANAINELINLVSELVPSN